MQQLSLIEIRDQREREWSWMDNLIIDEYGEILGASAIAVYAVLCRHSDNSTQSSFPSLETIARKAGLKSRMSSAKAIKKLEEYGIVSVQRGTDPFNGQKLNNIYTLVGRRFWKNQNTKFIEKEVKVKVPIKPMLTTMSIMEVSAFDLPAWLNKEMWAEWEEYRKQKKQKLTPLTVKRQIEFLSTRQKDHTKIILASITNGWTGLFDLKVDKKGGFGKPIDQDKARAFDRRQEHENQMKEGERNSQINDRIRELKKQSLEISKKFEIKK